MGTTHAHESPGLFASFPPTPHEAWEKAVQDSLKGRTLDSLAPVTEDGLPLRLLHRADEPAPAHLESAGPDLPLRGCASRQRAWSTDKDEVAHQLAWLAQRGQNELPLRVLDASPGSLAAWDEAVAALPTESARLLLEGGEAQKLGDWILRRDRGERLLVEVHGSALATGAIPDRAWATELAELWRGPLGGRAGLLLCAWPLHEAGATPAQELAAWLAMWAAALRELEAAGACVDQALDHTEHELSCTPRLFESMATLRAARLLGARFLEALGRPADKRVILLGARGSTRSHSRQDPWNNALRVTLEGFAARCAGVDFLGLPTLADGLGRTDEDLARLAFNTQEVLREEALLGHVEDPARGSGHVEELTLGLAEKAWALFQSLEAAGGLWKALEQGILQNGIAQAAQQGQAAFLGRRQVLVGSSRYALAREQIPVWMDPLSLEEEDAPGRDFAIIRPRRLSTVLEALHQRGRACARPIALVALGTMKEWGPRVDFCRDLLAAGGLEHQLVESPPDGEAAAQAAHAHGAPVLVLCGQDDAYAQSALPFLQHLRALERRSGRTPSLVLLAGRPAAQVEALDAAGLQGYVHLKATLDEMLEPILQHLEARP